MTSPMDSVSSLDSAYVPQDDSQASFDDVLDKADSEATTDDKLDGSQDQTEVVPAQTSIAPRSVILPQYLDPNGKTGKDKQPEPEDQGPKSWDAIVGADNGELAGELDRPLVMARKLLDNWESWRMHEGIQFANPPDDLSDEAKEVLKYFADSPSVRTALDNGFDTDKKANGTITRYEVGEFIKRAESDVVAAGNAYQEFLKKNPSADGAAKELAQTAAILMANQSLVASSGDRMKRGAEGQRENKLAIQPSNLLGAANDASLSQALRDAAATWSSRGMQGVLDVAGENAATVGRDRVIGRDNIASWLESAAPTTAKGVIDFIQQSAFHGLTGAVQSLSDEDKKHFFDNLDNRSAGEKAGVLAELTLALTRLEAGVEADIWGTLGSKSTLDDDPDIVRQDLQDKIEQLASESDVRAYIVDAQVDGLQRVVSQSPALKEQLQQYFNNEFKNGVQLNGVDFSKLDSEEPLSADDIKALGAQLAEFAHNAALFDGALGGDGSPDLTEALKSIGKYEQLEALYEDIKSGKMLAENIAAGASIEAALGDFAALGAGFSLFFGNGAQNDSTSLLGGMGNAFLDQANASDLDIFRGPDGEIDEGELSKFIEEAAKEDPGLFADDKGRPVSPNQIAGLVKALGIAMGTGMSARDAMVKLGWIEEGSAMPPKVLTNAHGSGVLQGVGAVLASGVLLTRVITGKDEAAKDKAAIVGNALTMFGATGGFVAKHGSGVIEDTLRPLLKGGSPLLGAAGSAIGGVMGIIAGVDQLKSGNKALGALGLTDGIVGTGLALLEGATAISGVLGLGSAGALASISSVLGPAGWVVGVGAALAQLLVGATIRDNKKYDFISRLNDELSPYGVGQETDWDSRKKVLGEGPDYWMKFK